VLGIGPRIGIIFPLSTPMAARITTAPLAARS